MEQRVARGELPVPVDFRRRSPVGRAKLAQPSMAHWLRRSARRSWWRIVTGICLGLAGAVLALDRIPQKYEATATIWAKEPEVRAQVAPTPAPDEMSRQLTTFEAALLREESMVELVKRVYGLAEHDQTLRGLIDRVRNNVSVTIEASRRQGWNVHELRYRDTEAGRAALTVNTLAELYLARNAVGSGLRKPGQATERLEAAAIPTVPYSPKVMRVYGVFLALGCLLFLGPVVARGLFRPVIWSEAGFGALSEIPVMVSIPTAATEQRKRSTQRRLAKNVTLSILSCAILVAALVFVGGG